MRDTPRTDALPVSDPMTEREAALFQHARTLERENAALRERVAELEADLNAWKAGGSTGTIHQWREDAARWNFVLRHRKYSDVLWNAVPIKKFMEERHLNNVIDAERGKP